MGNFDELPTKKSEPQGDYLEGFRKRVNLEVAIPGTRRDTALRVAENVEETMSDLPIKELTGLSYMLAAKLMEVQSREVTSSFAEWRGEHELEARLGDVVIQTVLSLNNKVAVPRTLNPEKYIKEIKKNSNWKRLFSGKRGREELDLEINTLVVEAVERVEALNSKAKDIEREQKEIIEVAERKAGDIIAEAKSEEQAIKRRVQILEERLAALRAEALQDPTLARALSHMEVEDEKEEKNAILARAEKFVARVQNITANAHADSAREWAWNSTGLLSKNHKEIELLLTEFLKTTQALKELENKFGPSERQKAARDLQDQITTKSSVWIYDSGTSKHEWFKADTFKRALGKLTKSSIEFHHACEQLSIIIPRLMGELNSIDVGNDNDPQLADQLNSLDTLIQKQ